MERLANYVARPQAADAPDLAATYAIITCVSIAGFHKLLVGTKGEMRLRRGFEGRAFGSDP